TPRRPWVVVALLLAQHQIDRPAAPDVRTPRRPRSAQVGEDVRVGAAGLFEGVGQERHLVEAALFVDGMGEGFDGGGLPGGVEGSGAQGSAKQAAKERAL